MKRVEEVELENKAFIKHCLNCDRYNECFEKNEKRCKSFDKTLQDLLNNKELWVYD